MAIVVRHKSNGQSYVLLGSGLAEYKTSRPGVMFGTLNPTEEAGRSTMLAVCDDDGRISWFDASDLFVFLVDGQPPGDVLKEAHDVVSLDAPENSTRSDPLTNDEVDSYLDTN